MPNDSQITRRRRVALGVLIALSLALLTFSFGETPGGALGAIERGAQETLAPLEEGASIVLKPFRDLIDWTGDVFEAKGENKDLEKEVSRLRKELADAQTNEREAEQLRALAGLSRTLELPDSIEPVTARVIARSPTVWYSAVQVDKGSDEGIRVDDPVVTGDGLAGRVSSVTPNTARVQLITDASSAVSAQIMPEGANGIVRPEVGNPDDLLLDFVEHGRDITEGTSVITSGFTSSNVDSLFPRGIPIGKVTRVEPGEVDLYQRVHIEPYADLRRVDFVRVLTGAPRRATPRAER